MIRSHYCGDVTLEQLGETITVAGWVNSDRDHGGVIFIDLRDASGLLQIVVNPQNAAAFAIAEKLRNECVIQLTGEVAKRPEGTINANLPSGSIEVIVSSLTLLNEAEPLPLQLTDKASEDTRLRYRYLDLRTERMQKNLKLRHQVTQIVRNYLENHRFTDVETPLLTRSTPEGARDYLVPSRMHTSNFFALPQSPQLFKQLLMMGGIERYYQIARCFRDEDLRADRQPEFTQIDTELAFTSQAEIMSIMEGLIKTLFNSVLNVDLGTVPKMAYAEAMKRFGTDRPDMRIQGLELIDVADLLQQVDFKVFASPANDPASRIAALKVSGGASMTRKTIDQYTDFVSIYGAKGLAYIKVNQLENGIEGLQSPILKFMPEAALNIVARLKAQNGDLIFFGADKRNIVNESLGALRLKIAQDLGLLNGDWAALWVIDFPMFERDSTGQHKALHHPFTAPSCSLEALQQAEDKTEVLSNAYDLIINGIEVGGGSLRIHSPKMQSAIFDILGMTDEDIKSKFGFLIDALRYGCPPHGGMAFGLDRLVMLMAGEDSIRNVIAFPKTQSSACMLTQAPGAVDFSQLRELGLQLKS